ncbi:hypothetical protein KFE98_16795 [bacterium SCSIO 12741]|nr:hypothetical protein KFE98_16795 [bacterium SCSIO 12741]
MEIYSHHPYHHNRIIDEFRKLNIPFEEQILNQQRMIPSERQPYGIFKISDEYSDECIPLIQRLEEEDSERIPEVPRKKLDYLKIGLGIYAVFISLLCFKYRHELQDTLADKNFDIKWNNSATRLNYFEKSNGKLVWSYFDKDWDLVFERMETYQDNVIIERCIDDNGDGYYENIRSFDVNGNYIGISEDRNGDTYIDYLEMILQDGEVLKLEDSNADGVFERMLEEKSR